MNLEYSGKRQLLPQQRAGNKTHGKEDPRCGGERWNRGGEGGDARPKEEFRRKMYALAIPRRISLEGSGVVDRRIMPAPETNGEIREGSSVLLEIDAQRRDEFASRVLATMGRGKKWQISPQRTSRASVFLLAECSRARCQRFLVVTHGWLTVTSSFDYVLLNDES